MKRGAKETESADDGMELRDGFTLGRSILATAFHKIPRCGDNSENRELTF